MNLHSWILLLSLSTCWGSSFMMISVALEDFSPVTIAFLRIFIGTLLLWLIVLWRGISVPRNYRVMFGMLCAGVLVTSLPFTLISWGQQQVASSLAAVLNATTAIFGVIIASLLFRDERMTIAKCCGVLVGFCGVVVTVGVRSLLELDITSLAQYAILGAAISYAFGGASAKVFMVEGSTVVHAAGMTSVGALLIFPFVLMQHLGIGISEADPRMLTEASFKSWAAVLWLGSVSTALAYLFYYSLLRAAGVTNLLLCTLVIVPIAIFLGAIFLNETLMLRVWIGFALITFGLLLIDGRILRFLRKMKV